MLSLLKRVRMNAPPMNKCVEVLLKNGARALLRPVQPDDKERIAGGLVRLSTESRYSRFFTPTPTFSKEQMRYLTEVDQLKHVAWIAVDPSKPAQPGLGIARFIRSDDDHSVAEAAFTVIDEYQHLGLGNHLLAVLYLLARRQGIRILHCSILAGNRNVTEWFRKLGASATLKQGVCEVDLPVHPSHAPVPDLTFGHEFTHILENLCARLGE